MHKTFTSSFFLTGAFTWMKVFSVAFASVLGFAGIGSNPANGQTLKFPSSKVQLTSGESAELVEFKQPLLFGVNYSSGGEQLAVTFRFAPPLLLDTKTWTNQRQLPALYQIVFSPDGKLMATAEGSDGLRLWDCDTDIVSTRHLGQQRSDVVRQVAFSPQGNWLASAHDDGMVWVWDVKTAKSIASLKGHVGAVNSVEFTHDGRRLYSGGMDSTMRIWDTTKWTLKKVVNGPKGEEVLDIAFAANDSKIVSVHSKSGVMIWNPVSWRASVHSGYFCIASARKINLFALGGRDILLTDGSRESERRLKVVEDSGKSVPTNALAFAPDDQQLAAGNALGELRIIDID